MPYFGCGKCHHEWEGEGTNPDGDNPSFCDWCGSVGVILEENTPLEKMCIEMKKEGINNFISRMMPKKKLRLLVTEECNRNCEGCCNKDFDISNLPVLTPNDFDEMIDYDMIMITGGEPMLYPKVVRSVARLAKAVNPDIKVILYTAKVNDLKDMEWIIDSLDGITLTIYDSKDISALKVFDVYLDVRNLNNLSSINDLSLRLNIFKDVEEYPFDFSLYRDWKIKDNIEWIKDCPLPDGEVFKKLKA